MAESDDCIIHSQQLVAIVAIQCVAVVVFGPFPIRGLFDPEPVPLQVFKVTTCLA